MESGLIQKSTSVFGNFMAQVYAWMVLGLVITFGVAFGVMYLSSVNNQIYTLFAIATPFVIIGQFLIVLVMAFLWRRLNAFISAGLFLFYSATMGVFFGVIFLDYSVVSIVVAFAASILTFGAMAVYGYVTKQDLTGWGRLAIFGLIGLIIATFVNILVYFIAPAAADTFNWILTYAGVAIFMILVAYDTQKLKAIAIQAEQSGLGVGRYAIQGALNLYLDFINLFIRILAITGRRK